MSETGYVPGRQVFEVTTNEDLTEGRGRQVHLAYFARRTDADRYAKGKGVMGTPADVRLVTLRPMPRVFECWEEVEASEGQRLRHQIASKLNPEERAFLGL